MSEPTRRQVRDREAVYTYEDGDRTIRVILQGDLVVQETGADTPSDGVARRTAGGNIVRKQSGQDGADLPVFRSASGGALMTLPGGVLLALDPEWDEAGVNRFFTRNNIWKGPEYQSWTTYRTGSLCGPNRVFRHWSWPMRWRRRRASWFPARTGGVRLRTRQDPGEPKGDDRRGH